MSISNSIASAMSGLTATSRAAQVVSSNLANAMNENYGRRELELSAHSHTYGGGVKVAGITRHVDPVLLADTRTAESSRVSANIKAEGAAKMADVLGDPDDPYSISGRLRDLEASLAIAESNPSSEGRLKSVLASASALSQAFNDAEASISLERKRADSAIAEGVMDLNVRLKQIATLNKEIVSATINQYDTSGLKDQRQTAIDEVNRLVPVRELQGRNGEVTLTTAQGLILTNHKAVEFEFSTTNVIMPQMTAENGLLDQVSVDGLIIDMSSDRNPLAGGSLQAQFNFRDQISIDAQNQIDSLAYELTARFDSANTDPTLGLTNAGLFTDNGNKADSADISGLAGRLSINDVVDPARGGVLWKLQSGMQSAVPVEAGDSTIFAGMISAIGNSGPGSTATFSQNGNMFDFASKASTVTSVSALHYQQQESFSESRYEQMRQLQLSDGVDTDNELQRLLMIETNYAANARLLQTVDAMLDSLMRIGA